MRRLLPLLIAASLVAQESESPAPPHVGVRRVGEHVHVEIGGKLFTKLAQGRSRPVFYPVLGPNGVPMTRGWPLEEGRADETHDHPHHQSLWFAHGAVNGVDFWSEGPTRGRIIQQRILTVTSGPRGVLSTSNAWRTPSGEVLLDDTRTVEFFDAKDLRGMDWTVTLHATHGDVVFGDTKEGTFALRTHPALRLRGKVAKGSARNSEGITGSKIWGRRAAWVHYHGPVEGRSVGITLIDHPKNPRHPTWWHARDYGLLAANPFGLHDFEKKPKGSGDLTLKEGNELTFRYRLLFHDGEVKDAALHAAASDFARTAR